MNMTKKDLLSLSTVRTESVKLDCLKNTNFKDKEFLLKEMNITENKEYNEILKSEDGFEKCVVYACKSVMVEPSFFTPKEFETIGGIGKAIMNEIFTKIPTIGMTAKEKKHYHAKIVELAKKQVKEDEVTEEKK